jgi:hypothetical protein
MRTKKVKPPPKLHEYLLNITKEYDEVHKKDFISFKFRTAKEFLTFKYIIKIETEIIDKKIIFKILGFSAPVSELSISGFAGFEYRFYDFKYSDYIVEIERKDSSKSKFKLDVQKSKKEPIKITRVPKDSFIDIRTQ